MSGTILWDVDTQHDFCHPDGALYVPGASHPKVRDHMRVLVQAARQRGWHHVASADSHVLAHPEIEVEGADWAETFPPHCIRGTHGALKISETRQRAPLVLSPEDELSDEGLAGLLGDPAEVLLLKHELSVFSNPFAEGVLRLLAPERIIVFGVATDICVDHTLAGLLERLESGVFGPSELVLVSGASAGLDPDREAATLERYAARGVRMATGRELLEDAARR